MYGQFAHEIPEEIDKDLSWEWLVQSDLKVVQEQALTLNYVKNGVDKASENPFCRMCGERGGTVQHIICDRKKTGAT